MTTETWSVERRISTGSGWAWESLYASDTHAAACEQFIGHACALGPHGRLRLVGPEGAVEFEAGVSGPPCVAPPAAPPPPRRTPLPFMASQHALVPPMARPLAAAMAHPDSADSTAAAPVIPVPSRQGAIVTYTMFDGPLASLAIERLFPEEARHAAGHFEITVKYTPGER